MRKAAGSGCIETEAKLLVGVSGDGASEGLMAGRVTIGAWDMEDAWMGGDLSFKEETDAEMQCNGDGVRPTKGIEAFGGEAVNGWN